MVVNAEVVLAKHEEQLGRLRDDFGKHEEDNEKAFNKIYTKLEEIKDSVSNRLPNWASFLFAVLMGLLGAAAGKLL